MGTESRQTRERQADKLYQFIYSELMKNARPPSQREMMEELGICSETLQGLLNLLVEQGRAIHRRGRPRQVWPREGGMRGAN